MKIIFKIFTILSVIISINLVASAQTYTDVNEGYWAYDAIERMSEKKWFSGYPDGTFRTSEKITRAEAMVVIVKFLGLQLSEIQASSYPDVKIDTWYAPYIEAGRGLLPVRADENTFRPDAPVLREDVIYAVVNMLGYAEDTKFADQSILNVYSDKISISDSIKPYVVVALNEDLVSGFPDGTVRAQDPLTRAEFATMLYRASLHGFKSGIDPALIAVSLGAAVNLRYVDGVNYSVYAGTGEHNSIDSVSLRTASFTSPESMAISDSGVTYIADSISIRKVKNNLITTIETSPSYLTPSILLCNKEQLYFISNEFMDHQGQKYYSIVKCDENGACEKIFTTEAVYSKVYDAEIYNGILYILQYNVGTGSTYLCSLNLESENFEIIDEVDGEFNSIAIYNEKTLFISSSAKGSIYKMNLQTKEISRYLGADNDTKLIDGSNPRFFDPRQIKCFGEYLYILDYNILRRVRITSSGLGASCETLAGKFTVENLPEVNESGMGRYAVFAPSNYMDFIVNNNNEVFMSDPKNSVIWKIK